MVKKVYESKRITLPEALAYLRKRLEDDEEDASYYQRIALEHAQEFSKLPAKHARILVEKLIEDFRLSEVSAISVVNVLPDTIDELRAVLGSEGRPMTTDTLYEMLNAISEVVTMEVDEEAEEPPLDDEI